MIVCYVGQQGQRRARGDRVPVRPDAQDYGRAGFDHNGHFGYGADSVFRGFDYQCVVCKFPSLRTGSERSRSIDTTQLFVMEFPFDQVRSDFVSEPIESGGLELYACLQFNGNRGRRYVYPVDDARADRPGKFGNQVDTVV